MDTGNMVILSKVGISPKKEGEAIRYEKTTTGKPKATFRGFKSVYDSKAENNTRWLNYNFEAYGDVVEKMRKMSLKEKSFINIIGHLDQASYKDESGNSRVYEKIVVDHVEYAQMAKSGKEDSSKPADATAKAPVPKTTTTPAPAAAPAAPIAENTGAETYCGETLDAPGYSGTVYMDDDLEIPFNI